MYLLLNSSIQFSTFIDSIVAPLEHFSGDTRIVNVTFVFFDSNTQAHTHQPAELKLIVYFFQLIGNKKKIKQSSFIYIPLDYFAMAKVPKRDIGFFLHVVRNALLGVSINKWRCEFILHWKFIVLNYIICRGGCGMHGCCG